MWPVVERSLRVHAAKDARSYDAANRAESLGYQGKEVPWGAAIFKSGGKAWSFAMAGQSETFPLTGNGVRTLCEDLALPRAGGQRSSECLIVWAVPCARSAFPETVTSKGS